jgi:hypothetical protein
MADQISFNTVLLSGVVAEAAGGDIGVGAERGCAQADVDKRAINPKAKRAEAFSPDPMRPSARPYFTMQTGSRRERRLRLC